MRRYVISITYTPKNGGDRRDVPHIIFRAESKESALAPLSEMLEALREHNYVGVGVAKI